MFRVALGRVSGEAGGAGSMANGVIRACTSLKKRLEHVVIEVVKDKALFTQTGKFPGVSAWNWNILCWATVSNEIGKPSSSSSTRNCNFYFNFSIKLFQIDKTVAVTIRKVWCYIGFIGHLSFHSMECSVVQLNQIHSGKHLQCGIFGMTLCSS